MNQRQLEGCKTDKVPLRCWKRDSNADPALRGPWVVTVASEACRGMAGRMVLPRYRFRARGAMFDKVRLGLLILTWRMLRLPSGTYLFTK